MTEAPQPVATSPTALHPIQQGRGVVKFYNGMARAEKAYRLVNSVWQGKRQMPLLNCPLGDGDLKKALVEGDPQEAGGDVLEFDIHAFFKFIANDTERHKALQEMLTPWNNWLVQEYLQQISRLHHFVFQLYASLSGGETHELDGDPAMPFDECIQQVHHFYREFEPAWKAYEAAEGEDTDPNLMLPGGQALVSLSQILTKAGVTDPGVVANVSKELLSDQQQTLQGSLLPCLTELRKYTTMAMRHMQQKETTG